MRHWLYIDTILQTWFQRSPVALHQRKGESLMLGAVACLAAVGLGATPAASGLGEEYDIVIIEPWDTQYRFAESSMTSLNNLNQALGCATPLTGPCTFMWTLENGKVQIDFGGEINDGGVIAGDGFVKYPDGKIVSYNGMWEGVDLNESVVIVGSSGYANCMKHNNTEGMVWSPDLGSVRLEQERGIRSADQARAINEFNEIVGNLSWTGHCGDLEAFYYNFDTEEYIDLHGLNGWGGISKAHDINDLGVVVGEAPFGNGIGQKASFIWTRDSGFEYLPAIPGGDTAYTIAQAINNHNQIVGQGIRDDLGGWHAFIWDETNGIRDLNELVAGLPPDFKVDRAVDINDNGWIVGTGIYGAWSPPRAVVLIPRGGQAFGLAVPELVAGQDATLEITNATPGLRQYITYSLRGLGSTLVPQLNVTLDLDRPSLLVSGVADASGAYEATVTVPLPARGRTVWFQAAEQKHTTNVVERTVM